MKGKKKGLIVLSALFTLSFSAALASCGGNAHDPQLVAGKDPTCTEAGYEQYYLCMHCDKMYSDEAGENEISAPVVKPALGHEMSKHDGVEATCVKPGNVEYYTCSREPGVYYADAAGTQTLDEIGVTVDHDFSGEDKDGNPNIRPAVDPTKETPGRKPSWTCNSCGAMYGDEHGDKKVTEEDLRIDPIQETIDGALTEEFYHAENAFVIGANNVRDGGLGMVLNATLAKDGVYFHLVTNYNTPAAEQDRWGSVKVYINARNTEEKYLPGNAAVSEAETIVMKLDLNGSITTHDAHTVKSFTNVENKEEGALTKYTVTWEVYCSFEQLAQTNRAALAYAFEKQEGKTVLKNGYNILVTTVGCMFNKDNAEKFENNGTSLCSAIGDGDVQEAWFLWEKLGYSDRNEGHKYMILTSEGFSKDFQTVATEYKVNVVKAENASLDGLPEKVAVNGTLQGTVASVKDGCVLLGLNVNGKTVKVDEGAFSVSLADLNLPWNTADITVTPVAVKNETQTVTLTLKDKSKQGVTALANTQVSLSDGYNEPIVKTTDAGGAVTFDNLLCTTYTLSVEGYPQKMFNVSKGTGTAESELIKIFAVSDNDDVYVDDLQKTVSIAEALPEDRSYTGSAEIVADSALQNVMFETTVNAENFEKGWNYKRTMQRFVIQMTDTKKGFFFWTFHREDIGQGYKANIKAINDLTNRENEGNAALDINNWTEDERGWIAQYVESGGLQLRVVRNGGSIALYAHNDDDGWVYLGSVECGDNDQTKIALYGTGCGWEFSEMNVTDLGEYQPEVAPVVGTPGHIAHFVNGNKYYLPDGTPTTADAVKTELTESQAKVTLALKDLDGAPVTVAAGTEVSVKSRYHNTTLTADASGLLSGTLYKGWTYTASLYGYKDAILTVEANGDVTLTMDATIAYASNDKVTVNETDKTITIAEGMPADKSYTGNAEVVTDSALNKANVLLETTVKGINPENGWTGKSNMQRFIIQMTDGNKGFFFWVWIDGIGKANYQEISSLTDRTVNSGRDLNNWGEAERGWISPLIMSNDGLKLRAVRNEDVITLYAYNGTEWIELGYSNCGENDNLKVCFYGTGCGWEFSEMNVTDLGEYQPEAAPVVGTPGHIAHYVNGSNYYLPDGTPTTADAVKTELTESQAKVTLVLKDLDGALVTVAAGTEVTVKSRYYDTALTADAGGLLNGTLYAGTYTASLYGYKDATFTVEENGNVTLTMNATLAYASNDKVTVNDTDRTITIAEGMPADKSYTGNAEVVTDGALKNADVVFETTVKAINFEDGWTGKGTMQRFIIQLADTEKGFFFWTFNSDGYNKANYQEISSLTNREVNNGRDLNGLTERERGWIVPFIKGEGLKLRAIRSGNVIALYAYNGEEWMELGYSECGENDNLKVCFYGTGCGWTFSQISVKAVTEYTLNATVKGNKDGVTANLDADATVRFTNLLGYDQTFTVNADGTIGGADVKLKAGVYTVTVSGNSYGVYRKNVTVSADVTEIVFDYEKFTIVEHADRYDLYDFSHVGDANAAIGNKEYIERFNALSTDKYDNVSVTLVGKFNNSEAGNRSQGIFIKFEDGKYMFLRFSWWADQYKIEFMQGGGDTWDLPVAENRSWDDVHMMTAEQTQKWTSGAEMELKLVREGKTLKVYFEGELVGTRELSEGYNSGKVQVGFFAMDAAADASWKFEISETLPEA